MCVFRPSWINYVQQYIVRTCSYCQCVVFCFRACSDLSSLYPDSRKYRNALHYVITCYCYRAAASRRTAHALGQLAEIVALLLENGLDINDHDVTGQSALHLAASYAHSVDVIQVRNKKCSSDRTAGAA